MDKQKAQKRIILLKEKILAANKAYFLENNELLPEEVRDSLKRELIDLEWKFPEFITDDSPTQRIWSPLQWFLPKIQHRKKKESLADVFSFNEIEDWLERVWKDIPWNYKTPEQVASLWITCELKLDWLNLTIAYKKWKLSRAATRWDWFIWEDVTNNIKVIFEIPLEIENEKFSDFEIWWEVFMSKKAFEFVQSKESDQFKNPRNCASWTLRQLDPQIVANRHLSFFAYEFHNLDNEKWKISTQYEKIENLKKHNFPLETHTISTSSTKQIKEFIETWTKKRNDLPYEIDWVVLKINDLTLQSRLWSTAKSPRWAVAYKFPAKLAQSEIQDIILQVWRTWVITPVAILNPVMLDWSTISRATLHNFDEIERLDVRIWDTVIIEKAWDIIPKVNQVIVDMRTDDSIKYKIPENCLDCGTKLIQITWEVALKCPNNNCASKHLQVLIHFCSRNALNIEGLWDKVVIQLFENKLVEDFWDIFTLTFWDFFSLPLFKEKKAKNLIENIEKSRNPLLSAFIFWLWIPYVWEETSFLLANQISKNIKIDKIKIKAEVNQLSLFDWVAENYDYLETCLPVNMYFYIQENIEKIKKLEWIWEKVIESIENYFNNEKNLTVLKKLENSWVLPKIEKVSTLKQIFSWKTFVLTWALPTLSRESAKEKIKSRWWSVSSSVSKNTDFVLAWESPWEKLDKANRLKVQIIWEKEFFTMIN